MTNLTKQEVNCETSEFQRECIFYFTENGHPEVDKGGGTPDKDDPKEAVSCGV